LNCEIGGARRLIAVQLPEETEDGSAAQRAGFKQEVFGFVKKKLSEPLVVC
jgi:hypothetical protein